ncbi:MAG: right-handed parallel beta-helix repeat-containing protein [Myxococcota bacterium]
MKKLVYIGLAGVLALSACDKVKEKISGEEKAEKTNEAAEAEKPKAEEHAPDKGSPTAQPETAKADFGEASPVEGGPCGEPVSIQKLGENTVLTTEGGGCYLVEGQLTVGEKQKLEIQPGVTIQFAENAGMVVHQGTLKAAGTADKPIVLTGQREKPGFWKGLLIQGSDFSDNTLEHVKITYAGNKNSFNRAKPAALMFDDDYGKSTFVIRRVELSNSETHGLYLESSLDLDFAENTITKNAEGAVYVDPRSLGMLDAKTTYTGNETDEVLVMGGKVGGIEATWPAIDVPYRVEKTLTIKDDAFVTVQPGATFKFDENAGLVLHKARMSASGTAEKPITFTGSRDIAGFWRGMLVQGSDSIDNALEHVTFSYAGAEKNFNRAKPAALMFDNDYGKSSFTIKDATFTDSDSYGMYVESNVELDFTENTLTQNKQGAAYVHPAIVGIFDGDSDYSGNENDRITMWDGDIAEEAAWPTINATYFIEKTPTVKEGFLTIEAGNTLAFAENQGFVVHKGKLAVKGTSDEPVVFTGAREVPGYWRGILLQGSDSIDNVIEHATIRFAGAEKNFNRAKPAALMFDSDYGSNAYRLDDLAVEKSAGAGLHVEKNVRIKSDDCGSIAGGFGPRMTEESVEFSKACEE